MPKTRAQLKAETNSSSNNNKTVEHSDSDDGDSDISMVISRKKAKRKVPSDSSETMVVPEKRLKIESPPPLAADAPPKPTNAKLVIHGNGKADTAGKLHLGLVLLQDALSQMISKTIKEELQNTAEKSQPGTKSKLSRLSLKTSEAIVQDVLQHTEADEDIGEDDEVDDDEEEDDDEEGDETTLPYDQLMEKVDELYNIEDDGDEDADDNALQQASEAQIPEFIQQVDKIQEYRKNKIPNIIKILSTKMSIEDKSKILDWFMMYNFSTEPYSEERIVLRNLINDYMKVNSIKESEDLDRIEMMEEKYRKIVDSKRSIRQRIHDLNTSEENKALIFEMFTDLTKTSQGHEDYEEKRYKLEMILNFPFGTYRPLPVQIGKDKPEDIQKFLAGVRRKLDENVLYLDDVKDQIITYVSSCILNPQQTPGAIAIEGSPGVGKSSLVMKGVSEALGLPFFHINGGGINDIHELRGSDNVYRGSGPGLLFKYAIEAKCLNFVFYFDEADKTSNRSNEVLSYMVHFFDNTSNSKMQDGYYKGISFDFSKCLKFVSYNSRVELGEVFGDRIQKFVVPEYDYMQKLTILKEIIVPRYLKTSGLCDKMVFTPEACARILSKQQVKEKGLRQTCRNVENLVKLFGTIYILIDPKKKKLPDVSSVLKSIDAEECRRVFSNVKFPLEITPSMVDLLWYEPKEQSVMGNMYS